jgi:hypothetical protein
MTQSCSKPDCTVAATGKCLLLHDPLETCPHFCATSAQSNSVEASPPKESPTFENSEVARRFFAGFELGTSDATEVMRGRYGTLIAVLGQYDVGKTCFLSSLYLLTSCRAIGSDLEFAGSLTLNGFEARARRIREWRNGALPKQLADHTVLSDERTAAVMHLALRETRDDKRRFDLLITDLPGEWSTDLVKDASTAPRFRFLDRADGIVITLDGPMLKGTERHSAAHNAKFLLTRLSDTLNVNRSIPLVLMVTKCDELEMKVPAAVGGIASHATAAGFAPKIIPVAAISRTPTEVRSGTGVMNVIEYVLGRKRELQSPELRFVKSSCQRNFARIGG